MRLLWRVREAQREIFLKARSQAAVSTAPVQAEFRIIRPNGDVRFVRTSGEAVKGNQGTPTRLVGATQDITEQVYATELLRESEKRLRITISGSFFNLPRTVA